MKKQYIFSIIVISLVLAGFLSRGPLTTDPALEQLLPTTREFDASLAGQFSSWLGAFVVWASFIFIVLAIVLRIGECLLVKESPRKTPPPLPKEK
jgi:hypothetical protein